MADSKREEAVMTDAEIYAEIQQRLEASGEFAEPQDVQAAFQYVDRSIRMRPGLSVKAALYEYLYAEDEEDDSGSVHR
jgi:hypothetical protein